MSRLGPLIRKKRLKEGVKQNVYAKRLNISSAHMSKLEAGKHVPKENTTITLLNTLFPELKLNLLILEKEYES